MSPPNNPPPRESLPPDPDDDAPASVGMAEMKTDGTLHLHLRTETGDGTVGEALMIVLKSDKRYQSMVDHLTGMKPGESRPIPPFPEAEVDPNSV